MLALWITILFPLIAPMLLGIFYLERNNSAISHHVLSLFGVLRYSSFKALRIAVQTAITIPPIVVFLIRNWNDNE